MNFGKLIAVVLCLMMLGGLSLRAQELTGVRALSNEAEPASAWDKYQLGLQYAEGRDKPRDAAIAARWMRLSHQDTAPFLVTAGWRGPGPRLCQRDELYRIKPWTDLTDSETDPTYILQLSGAYALGHEYGYPVARDANKSIALLRKAAEASHPAAQDWLFYSLFYEDDDTANDAEAIGWARRASDQGDFAATFRLGTIYEDGFHVQADSREALRLYQLAHKQEVDNLRCWKQRLAAGDPSAALNIGFIYHKGIGVTVDTSQAGQYFEIAADSGDAQAQVMMGEVLMADYKQNAALTRRERCQRAAPYYRKSADQGNAIAKALLAGLINSKCIAGTEAEAFALKLSAAEDPFLSYIQFEVAMAYRDGRGVKKDRVQASKWFAIIAHIGPKVGFSQMATDEWKSLQQQMSSGEKAAARSEAKAWLNTHPFRNFAGAPALRVE